MEKLMFWIWPAFTSTSIFHGIDSVWIHAWSVQRLVCSMWGLLLVGGARLWFCTLSASPDFWGAECQNGHCWLIYPHYKISNFYNWFWICKICQDFQCANKPSLVKTNIKCAYAHINTGTHIPSYIFACAYKLFSYIIFALSLILI